jgi:hypothetical protein
VGIVQQWRGQCQPVKPMLRIAHGARCQRSPVDDATRRLFGVPAPEMVPRNPRDAPTTASCIVARTEGT